jgi:hypothetical protein
VAYFAYHRIPSSVMLWEGRATAADKVVVLSILGCEENLEQSPSS